MIDYQTSTSYSTTFAGILLALINLTSLVLGPVKTASERNRAYVGKPNHSDAKAATSY